MVLTSELMLMTLPPRIEIFEGFLGGQQQAEHVQIKMFVEMFPGDLFERGKFIEGRIVHKNVNRAEGFLRLSDQFLDVGLTGDIGLQRDGFAAGHLDFIDDVVGAGLAGGIIHDYRGAFRREILCDGRADAFGGAGDDGYLTGEFFCVGVHIFPSPFCQTNC